MSGSPIPDFRYNINESSYISASTVIDQHRNVRTNISNEATNIGYGAALSATLQSLHHSALPATVPSVVGFNNGSVATAVAADAANSQSSASTASTGSIQQRDDVDTFYFYETEQFTVLWILFAMIVLGNSAVLGTLIFNKSRKSRMNFFVKQLAIADLAVGLINVLTDIITRITITWHAGNVACKLIRFVEAVVTFSSTYVLVALTIDRYDAITHPMKFSGSWRRARVLVITAWLLSVLFSLPLIFLFEEKPIQGQMQCWIDLQPWQWKVYMTLIALVLFVIPAVIITACYTIIVRTIWSKSLTLAAAVNAKTDISSFVLGDDHRALRHHINNSEEDCRRASSRGVIPKAKVKTVKMTFVIVFVFVICWSPYIVFDLLQVYGYIPPTQTNIAIATFIQSLAPLNSAANPVIYCLFSTQMCRTLRNFPPFKWVASCLTMCFPGLETGGGYCLGYGNGDSTRTVTTSITHSSRRSGSATSVRNVIRLQTMNSRHRTAVMAATATAAGVVPVAVAGNSVKKVAISVV